jgi:hypothetical protein
LPQAGRMAAFSRIQLAAALLGKHSALWALLHLT